MVTKGRAVPEQAEAPEQAETSIPLTFNTGALTLNHVKLLMQLDLLATNDDAAGAAAYIPAVIDMLNDLSGGEAGRVPGLKVWPAVGELRRQINEATGAKN